MGIDPVKSKGRFFQFNKNNQEAHRDFNLENEEEDNTIETEASVSSLSKALNDFYNFFKSTGNESALKGLDIINLCIIAKPDFLDYLVSSTFIESTNHFKLNDEANFTALFELVDKADQKGLEFYRWIRSFNAINDYEIKKKLIQNLSAYINSEIPVNELKNNYQQFVIEINNILRDTTIETQDKSSKIENLFINLFTVVGI